jgi:HAD superfamily hydrolase (TIGR01509 family)
MENYGIIKGALNRNKMIKLIIFDLDGVLIDSRELHYKSLNSVLFNHYPKYKISKEEHLSIYDGLPTTQKLKLLTKNKGLPESLYDDIWERKQKITIDLMEQYTHDNKLNDILYKLKQKGYKIGLASNSIRQSVLCALHNKGILHYFDYIYSNEDVLRPKPNPEMYYRTMIQSGFPAKETLIVEDSNTGRKAVIDSGAHLCAVTDPEDLTYEKINTHLKSIKNKSRTPTKWEGKRMNVLIPMAGAGARFEEAGYTFPKPLIDVKGKPMIQLVVESLNMNARFIFIVQKKHYEKYALKHTLNLIAPDCEIVQVDGVTEGAACTTLLAKSLINNDDPLLIANSDQYLEWDSNQFMYSMTGDSIDGGILTFPSTHPKWSYAEVSGDGLVIRVEEKIPISEHATVGVYYFKKGESYVRAAEQMIKKNIRTNGEFYVCPAYNQCILNKEKIKIHEISQGSMWGLGTPEDLAHFCQSHETHSPQR